MPRINRVLPNTLTIDLSQIEDNASLKQAHRIVGEQIDTVIERIGQFKPAHSNIVAHKRELKLKNTPYRTTTAFLRTLKYFKKVTCGSLKKLESAHPSDMAISIRHLDNCVVYTTFSKCDRQGHRKILEISKIWSVEKNKSIIFAVKNSSGQLRSLTLTKIISPEARNPATLVCKNLFVYSEIQRTKKITRDSNKLVDLLFEEIKHGSPWNVSELAYRMRIENLVP